MKRVLLVDDDADIRVLYSLLLKMGGHEVVLASGGEEALEKLRKEPIDVVLTDVMMPGIDGLELLRIIRRDPALQKCPVILMSAAPVEVETFPPGFAEFLSKPIEAGRLLETVERKGSCGPVSGGKSA